MRNKKQHKKFWKENWLPFLIFAVIIFGMVFVIHFFINSEPNFKITKEECSERDVNFNIKLEDDGNFTISYSLNENGNLTFTPSRDCDFDKLECVGVFNSCEQVEVDLSNAVGVCFEENKCFNVNEDGIKWLEENCGCIKKDYGEIINSFPKFNRSDQTNSNEDYSLWKDSCWYNGGKTIFTCEENPRDLLCCYKKLEDNFECSKYKCGENYIVEVLK